MGFGRRPVPHHKLAGMSILRQPILEVLRLTQLSATIVSIKLYLLILFTYHGTSHLSKADVGKV